MNNKKTSYLTLLAMFVAIELLLTLTPLGYIPLGFMNMTTMHIPVIVAGIALGAKGGAIIGLVFGLTSILRNTMMPLATAFVFSPFVEIGGVSGNLSSVLIAIVPRVMIGVIAAVIYQFLIKRKVNDTISIGLAGLCASLTNTILVMGGIYVFFGESYAAATNVAYDLLIKAILTLVSTTGLVEAIGGTIIALGICKVLNPITKKLRGKSI